MKFIVSKIDVPWQDESPPCSSVKMDCAQVYTDLPYETIAEAKERTLTSDWMKENHLVQMDGFLRAFHKKSIPCWTVEIADMKELEQFVDENGDIRISNFNSMETPLGIELYEGSGE